MTATQLAEAAAVTQKQYQPDYEGGTASSTKLVTTRVKLVNARLYWPVSRTAASRVSSWLGDALLCRG